MKTWKKLPTISAPMPFQMGFDDLLFHQMIEAKDRADSDLRPILRFYYASEPAISLGYAYAGWKAQQLGESDAELYLQNAKDNLPVCRRFTGGGRVLHGKDLMFSLFALKNDDESFKSVRDSYHKIHETVADALTDFNKETQFYRCEEDLPKGKDCFVYPIATDLSYQGKKIAGGGQKRSLGVMLHEESIQLKELQIDAEELIEKLEEKFKKVFGIELEDANLRPEWMEEAEILGQSKYRVNALEQESE